MGRCADLALMVSGTRANAVALPWSQRREKRAAAAALPLEAAALLAQSEHLAAVARSHT